MTRSFRGSHAEGGRERGAFDPVVVGLRLGLSAEVARDLWEGITRASSSRDGGLDEARARETFEELARRVAERGGRIRAELGKSSRGEGDLPGRARGGALTASPPGKATLVEKELPRFGDIPPQLASLPPVASPARAASGAETAAKAGKERGASLTNLDEAALLRRAEMLVVLPYVTARWKEAGGALFSPAAKPAAPRSPEGFTEQAYVLLVESIADVVPVAMALSGPGREPYLLALHHAIATAEGDRPMLARIQEDVAYLVSGGDLQFAAPRILASHALASSLAKNALRDVGALAGDALLAYAKGEAGAHGMKLRCSELIAEGVDPAFADMMSVSGSTSRVNAILALRTMLVAGATADEAKVEATADSEEVKAEAKALAQVIRAAVEQKDERDRLSPEALARLDTALGAASARARELVWQDQELTGLVVRALDPAQSRQLIDKLDTVEELYQAVRSQVIEAMKLAYGPKTEAVKPRPDGVAYATLVTWLVARPGEANRELRTRLLHHTKLKSEIIDQLSSAQQRTIYRLIANGTNEPTAEDRIHEAAESGNGAEVVRALRALASKNPQRLAELERDTVFRQSIERMREIVDVDGVPLRPYDVCLAMWGRDPHASGDPLVAAQTEVNLTGNTAPLTADERIQLDQELFEPALADIHAQVTNKVAQRGAGVFAPVDLRQFSSLPRAQSVLDRLRSFERLAAQKPYKDLLQRDHLVAGVELAKRFGARWNIDLRTWVYENGGPNIRSGVARILGTEHGASVGMFNGEVVGLGEALPDKVTMQQALRETTAGPDGWTISEWCSVESRAMSRAIDARNKRDVLAAWNRLHLAIEGAKAELERLTGRKIRAIDLLRNAMMEHGGHLEARIAEKFSPSDRDELCEELGIRAANLEDASLAPKPDPAERAEQAYGATAQHLWAALSRLHAGSSANDYRALGALITLTRTLPRLDTSGPAASHDVDERPPRSFAAYYRARYGTSVEGHAEAVLRAMPSRGRTVPLAEAAHHLGIDPERLAAPPRAPKEELVIDETNQHLVRAEFTVEQARGRAKQIWEILHGSGRLDTINKQLYGDCNDEEQRLIRIAFRQLSGGYDLAFYLQQALEQRKRSANPELWSLGASMPWAAPMQPTELAGTGGVRIQGTETELERALAVATVGEVDLATRLSAAIGRGNVDHVFRLLDEASMEERRAILADGALVNRLRGLGQWQWERCYKVLTNQADLADRLYSRSHGDGGFLERTFGGTHEEGMKEDLRRNAARLRLKYDAEVRAEVARMPEKPDPRAIDREINRRVLEAAGINAADPSVRAILRSELSGTELAEIESMVLNAGTARDWAVACGGGAQTILAEIRALTPEQREAKLRDPQYLRLLGQRLPDEKDYREAVNALRAVSDADIAHGGGALARLDAASRTSKQVSDAEPQRRETLQVLTELTPAEYERLLADPKLQLQVMEALSADERVLAREILELQGAQRATKETGETGEPAGDEASAATRDPVAAATQRAELFVHQSVWRLRIACRGSWRDVLVQATEIFKLDFSLGFTRHGEGGHGARRAAEQGAQPTLDVDGLRSKIWTRSRGAVRELAREHDENPGKKTRDAITGKRMVEIVEAAVLGHHDPSDALIAENILTVDEKLGKRDLGMDRELAKLGFDASADERGLANTLRAASDKHVAEQWTSIRQTPAGGDGDTMQARYRELVQAEAAASAHQAAQQKSAASVAAMPASAGDVDGVSASAQPGDGAGMYAVGAKIDDPVLRRAVQARRRFLEYQIKIAQALEDMLLPYMGDDRRRSEARKNGEQQIAGRDNKRYNDLAQIILERIPRLPPEVVGAAIGVRPEHQSLLASDARRHAGEMYLRDQRDLRYGGTQTSARSYAQDEKEVLDEEQTRLGRHHALAITDGEISAAENQEYERRYDAVDRAHEAHQAAKETVAGWASLIVGTIVTIAATVLTGGLATGPVAMMALAGATAALSATAKSLVMEEVLEGEWDRQDAARMIASEVITGLVTMGTTYYAQRVLAAAAGATSLTKQSAAVRQVMRKPPRLYYAIANEAIEEGLSEAMSGVVESGLEAIDPVHWMHGYEQGAHLAKQAALARLAAVPDNMVQGGVTAVITSVGGRVLNRARRGGGHFQLDPSQRDRSLDVPASQKKRVDVIRNLKQVLGDPGEKFLEALVQWGMEQDGPINWAAAPAELLRGWIEEMGEAPVEVHTGTVHRAKRDARTKAEIERAKGKLPEHELRDYQEIQDGALDNDVFITVEDYQNARTTVARRTLEQTERRHGFVLSPFQRRAFLDWVRTSSAEPGDLTRIASVDPRTLPEVMSGATVVREKSATGEDAHVAPLIHFGENAEAHLAFAARLGVLPKHEVQVRNAVFRIGDLFEVTEGRVAVLFEVELDGKRYLRAAYRSNSQGGFRILPARNIDPFIPEYDKSIGEHAIMLPSEIEELLSARLAARQVRRDLDKNQAELALVGSVLNLHDKSERDAFVASSPDHLQRTVEQQRIVDEAKDWHPTATDVVLPAPGQVSLTNEAQRPDYRRLVRSYTTSTALAGDVTALVYHSHDGSLEYVLYKDDRGRVWFKSVAVVDAEINAQGVASVAVDTGALCTPLWEYAQQLPSRFRGASHPQNAHYVDAWAYLSQIPEIQAFYAETGTPMPDVASDVPKRVTARMPSAEAPSDGDTSDRTEQQEVTTRERVTQRMDAVEVPAHERVTQRMDAVEVPAHERVTQRMDAVEVPAHERVTQRMDAVEVPAHERETQQMDAVESAAETQLVRPEAVSVSIEAARLETSHSVEAEATVPGSAKSSDEVASRETGEPTSDLDRRSQARTEVVAKADQDSQPQLVVRSPGEIPASATPEQREILEKAAKRYELLAQDRYFSRESAEVAWAIYLRDHGIGVENLEIVDDVEHDRDERGDGKVRHQTVHPQAIARARRAAPGPAYVGSEVRGDVSDTPTEFRERARPENRPDLALKDVAAALGELVRTGGIPGDVQLVNPHELRIVFDATRPALAIELQPPTDLRGSVAQSDIGASPERVRVWISSRILDEHVPRALGGIIGDVIARSSGRPEASTSAAREGELRAMFAHLRSLENAPPPSREGDAHERAMRDGRAETVGRVRAELDLVLHQMGLVSSEPARRAAALSSVSDPVLRAQIEEHTASTRLAFDASAAERIARSPRIAPVPTATDLAASSGQVLASSVLPPPPADPIRPFTAEDHARIVELRFHFEVIAELDARLAARDRPGAARKGVSPALGESLRRRQHVARAKELLAELQIGGTDPEFIRTRLQDLTAVFPGTDDLADAITRRVQRRIRAVDAHQRAESFRAVRERKMKELAELVRGEQPFRTDRVIVGGGMAGTTRAAGLGTPVSGDMVDPRQQLLIGGDDMVSRWAPGEYWGQRMGVFEREDATHPMYRGAPEGSRLDDVVEDPGEFMHVGELNDSMDLARQRLGLIPVGARVLRVEVAKSRTPWPDHPDVHPDEYPVKVTIDLAGERLTIYTKHTDITTGLGNTAMPNEGILTPEDRSALLATSGVGGEVLRGGERLMDATAQISGRVLVVAFGPTGAWAARRALQLGASHVEWAGTAPVAFNAGGIKGTAGIDRTQDAFNDERIHRTTDQIMRIDPDGDGAVVTFAYPDSEGSRRYRTYKVRYDHVLMTQGFDSSGGGASAGRPSASSPHGDNRVGTIIGGMPMRPQEKSSAPILENDGPFAGRVSVIGAAAWDAANVIEESLKDFGERQRALVPKLTSDSPDARTLEAVGHAVDQSR